MTGRDFEPTQAGGPVRRLSTRRLKVTDRGIDAVERQLNQSARLTVLRLIGEHDGEWGWYQFERAFPPGWFTDEPPNTRARDILNQLEMDGLVTTIPGESQRKYRLTDQGMNLFREAAIVSTAEPEQEY